MYAKILNQLTAPKPVSRRRFLLGAGAVAGGLAVGFRLPPAQAQEGETAPINPLNAYITIHPDNTVTVLSSQFDMGQGAWHGLASLVVEELGADWDQITVKGVNGNPAAYGNLTAGGAFQLSGGSSSVFTSFDRYRVAGATAREMLKAAAAKRWNVNVDSLVVSDGFVRNGDQAASFGDLVADAAQIPVPENVALKPREEWSTLGSDALRRFDTDPKTRGTFTYTGDVQIPGMLTAVMIHPPRFGATVKSFDGSKALARDGVEHVVAIHRGVAVVAKTMFDALQGKELVEVEWDESAAEKRGSDALLSAYRETVMNEPEVVARTEGDAPAAIKQATQMVEATYEFPYLAHAAMEPLNAVAHMRDDGVLDLYGGHQAPDLYQMIVSGMTELDMSNINLVIMPTGGGFGRRAVLDADVVTEAAMVAKAIDYSAPVKVQWTRENDTLGGRYRPATIHRVQAGLDENGNIVGWDSHIVSQSLIKGTAFDSGAEVDNTVVEGASNLPYAIDNLRVGATMPQVGVPVLWWRAVGSTHTAYAVETFIDELAAKAKKDPVDYRLAMLKDHPRHAAVLKLAAEKAGWGEALPEGRYRGVSLHESFKSYVAQVVEISIEDDLPKVHKVVCAVDCGIAINPDVVRAQMEGGIGFGLGAVLAEELTLKDGYVQQSNYDAYTPLRMNASPEVEVHIVDSDAGPTGVGEPGVPPIGPAVANAVRSATGKHVTTLPFQKGMRA
ncbi:aldehyde oxidase and xanthine dehydrogenase, molybdopterin binding [Luminiphilus syltensis NOR5-1B]|uniref:Aldehyde oxidase and xanthine dehydrogenase, molybdopterin binding n=1 Tax=Luminiphilus syltensis NOR5-1B TaxID=565045 RepID=B8KXV5_9GAMM|nr:xanthine dehydrogenase family protein molybdopterin-binding subunit [Luminiphilus syltensis]EED36900.1 aldehyde oxidase and xanthine dehydrogenase, molybdopterin binding [Luminiphilus syltensis NOR5-1B]